MGSYYANAFCCVCASRAADSTEGFLTERKVARYGWRPMCIPRRSVLGQASTDIEKGFLEVKEPERRLAGELRDEPLMQRAWCFQEWMLSPRKLHWTKNGLFWECKSIFGICEDNTPCVDWTKMEEAPLIFQLPPQEALVGSWYELVSKYSARNLSYGRDRLAAIQGVASQLAQKHNVEYRAGLFRYYLANGLCWSRVRNSWALTNRHFPSWSWACMSPVKFTNSELSNESLIHSARFQAPARRDIVEDFSDPTSRLLHLEAPLMELELVAAHTDEFGDEERRIRGANIYTSPTWPNSNIWFTLDSPQVIPSRVHVVWLIRTIQNTHLGEDTKCYVELLLKKSRLGDRKVWERRAYAELLVHPEHDMDLTRWRKPVDLI